MLRHFFSLVLVFILAAETLHAQSNALYTTEHRPAGLNWQELNSPHFRIIFPEGFEEIARRSARILESQYDETYALTGGELDRFPVVLATYNDLTNGFVTSVNFRSEVDLAPFKGKSLNPQSGSWLETVLPHELLHANHANVTNPYSLATAFGLMSPDFRRSFNFFPPVGVHEGLAVHHESEHGLHETSGRSNYTFFNNQFNANLVGPNTWNMGQTLITSDYTLPRNRHYLGGAHFTSWLHETYGEDVSKRAIAVHQNMFFLGYGYALWHVTGKWPGQLYKDYLAQKNLEEDARLIEFSSSTDDLHTIIGSPFKGVRQNRPVWISETELLYYSRQYNAPSAFYKINLSTGRHEKISEHFLSSDFYMDFDADNDRLYISENFRLERIFSSFQTDLVELTIENGFDRMLTDRARVYAPEKTSDRMYAIQVSGDVANIVEIIGDDIVPLTSFSDRTPIAIKASHLDENQLAVVVNQRGIQALWIVSSDRIAQELDRTPDLAFVDGSIHDPVWHPTQNKLMFTVDAYPAMNIFEYDLDSGSITQITNSAYNAFEASYSTDASSIAYVHQVDNQQLIATLDRSDFFNREVSERELLSGNTLDELLNSPFLGDELIDETENWGISDYRSDLNWLKPRAVIPVVKDKSGTSEWGVNVLSTDVLQSQEYSLEVTGIQDQLWYDLSYTNRTFYPGVRLSAYREPQFVTLNLENIGLATFLQEERGWSLSVPFQYYFKDATRFSSVFFQPGIHTERFRLHDLSPNPVTDLSSQFKGSAFAQLNYRILLRPRDVQPSSGFQVFGQYERIFDDKEITLSYQNNQYLLQLPRRDAFFYGVNMYTSLLPKTNQSLLLSAQFLNQSEQRIFSNSTIIPFGVDDNIFAGSSSLGRFSTRYVVPVSYPDKGGLLVPFYISSIYLSFFTHSLFDFELSSPLDQGRTVLGSGLHFRFKVSNLAFDLGFGVAYDLSKNTTDFILGSF